MPLTVPEVRPGRLSRRNPAAKLAGATLLSVVLVASLDVLTPVLVLLATLPAVPWTGVGVRLLLHRARLLLVSAVAVGVVNAAFGTTDSGRLLLDLGPVEVTSGGALTGLALALRVLAIGLPGLLVVASTDPVDLADSLVQQLRAPARFAYGALAALRLLPLLGQEWQVLGQARRARGVEPGRHPAARVRSFAGKVFALLVGAIRRGTRLATAMDARGFDSGLVRSAARTQRVDRADRLLVLACAAVAAGTVIVGVLLGTWRPLVGG